MPSSDLQRCNFRNIRYNTKKLSDKNDPIIVQFFINAHQLYILYSIY